MSIETFLVYKRVVRYLCRRHDLLTIVDTIILFHSSSNTGADSNTLVSLHFSHQNNVNIISLNEPKSVLDFRFNRLRRAGMQTK